MFWYLLLIRNLSLAENQTGFLLTERNISSCGINQRDTSSSNQQFRLKNSIKARKKRTHSYFDMGNHFLQFHIFHFYETDAEDQRLTMLSQYTTELRSHTHLSHPDARGNSLKLCNIYLIIFLLLRIFTRW